MIDNISSMTHMNDSDIMDHFPIVAPFRFIDEVLEVDAKHILGSYTFPTTAFFYEGHFPGRPITPGTILQESAEQIGLLAFGMYLFANKEVSYSDVLNDFISAEVEKLPYFLIGNYKVRFYLVESSLKFKKVILPGDRVTTESQKVFFRLNKLKCKIVMRDSIGAIVAEGIMSGMIHIVN